MPEITQLMCGGAGVGHVCPSHAFPTWVVGPTPVVGRWTYLAAASLEIIRLELDIPAGIQE